MIRAGRNCGPPGQPCPPPSIRYSTTGGHPGADQVSRVTGGSPSAPGSRETAGPPLTRGRWPPDLLPRICAWFAGRGFDELWVSDPAEGWGAAAHRFTGTPDPLEAGARMFTFRGHDPRTGPPRHLP